MSTSANIEARVDRVITERLDVAVATPTTDMIDSGLLDSLSLVMLIAALEEEFECEFPLDDFDPDDFRTVSSIAHFVTSSGVVGEQQRSA